MDLNHILADFVAEYLRKQFYIYKAYYDFSSVNLMGFCCPICKSCVNYNPIDSVQACDRRKAKDFKG